MDFFFLSYVLGWIFIAIILRLCIIFIYSGYTTTFFSDGSVHFSIIKALKSNPKIKKIDQFLIQEEDIAYPLLFHRFCSLFPIKTLSGKPFLPNLIIFLITSTIGYIYGLYILNLYYKLDPLCFTLGYFSFTFFVTSNLHFSGEHSHYISLTERLLGKTSSGLYVLGMIHIVFFRDFPSLLLCLIAGLVALLSSKFARQVIVFFSLIFSILAFEVLPIVLCLIIVTLAGIFSKGYFFRTLKFQYRHLKVYQKKLKHDRALKSMLFSYIRLADIRRILTQFTLNSVKRLFLKKEPINALLMFPENILILVLFFSYQNWVIDNIYLQAFLSIYILYLFTSFQSLSHLGESWRYIEYGACFITPLVWGIYTSQIGLQIDIVAIIMALIVYSVFISAVFFGFQLEDRRSKDFNSFIESVAIPEKSVIYPIPLRLGPDLCARKDYLSFWWQPGVLTDEVRNKYIESYPFPKKNFESLFREYKVNYIVADKISLQQSNIAYDFSKYSMIGESERYIAYQVEPVS